MCSYGLGPMCTMLLWPRTHEQHCVVHLNTYHIVSTGLCHPCTLRPTIGGAPLPPLNRSPTPKGGKPFDMQSKQRTNYQLQHKTRMYIRP